MFTVFVCKMLPTNAMVWWVAPRGNWQILGKGLHKMHMPSFSTDSDTVVVNVELIVAEYYHVHNVCLQGCCHRRNGTSHYSTWWHTYHAPDMDYWHTDPLPLHSNIKRLVESMKKWVYRVGQKKVIPYRILHIFKQRLRIFWWNYAVIFSVHTDI